MKQDHELKNSWDDLLGKISFFDSYIYGKNKKLISDGWGSNNRPFNLLGLVHLRLVTVGFL